MYIRRKVFSLLEIDGEERYFSTTEFENVSEDEVRLFSDDEKKKMSNKQKAAIAATAAAAATAAVIGGKSVGKALEKSGAKKWAQKKNIDLGEDLIETYRLSGEGGKVARALQKPADIIVEGAKGALEGAKKGASKLKGLSEEQINKLKEKLPKKASSEAGK